MISCCIFSRLTVQLVSLQSPAFFYQTASGPKPDSTSVQQLSQDDNHAESFTDDALGDVNILMSLQGLKSTANWPCNATVDSTATLNDTITYFITYAGANCNGTLLRTGQVEIKKRVGTHWFMAGATVMVRFINLKFTRISNGVYIIMNGRKTYQNVSGGHLLQLGNGLNALIYRTHGYNRVTFPDNTTRMWHIARQQVFTLSPQGMVIAVEGFGNAGGSPNTVTWGTDRNNVPFFIRIPQSIILKEACQWRICAGVKEISIPSQNQGATLVFGFNQNNQQVQPADCPVKFKIDWYKDDLSGTIWLWL